VAEPNEKAARENEKTPFLSVRGKLVGLAQWSEEYLDRWIASQQDPSITLFSDGGFLLPVREQEAQMLEWMKKREAYAFAIYALENIQLIGSCALFNISHRRQCADFGISIFDKNYWSKGYGTEATRLTLDYGFRFLNLHNISLDTMDYNKRAIRAYEKAGFKIIGRRREVIPIDGKRYDQIYMDCLATEFESPEPGWYRLEE
jgi:RimJ/RimL family protein N-acetyltransferase